MPFTFNLTDHSKGTNKVFNDKENEYTFEYPCSSTYDCAPYEVNFPPGSYLLEVWGAQGGWYNKADECLGGYSKGILSLKNETKGYLYVGGRGTATTVPGIQMGGFNGGGNGYFYSAKEMYGGGGGGASDIRLEMDLLTTRIIAGRICN
ncbi:hypothetical protein TVAG_401180 [Trichomonas vaginalis G3]|uniref:receptor protein-tyrosine kinase n=1 Tax=Trichomonas vaginalis (strain ATCC PRA-98 / G3) TaxID=412133 RepID=A2E3M6_TRIV3|nr:glycine-rich protein family [Trichomonas vaginalis G3]EAY12792.1 hypothetical protein TVAG_401180 [Trichomonas vaginalis G3]KAI5505584.1 glycine-rich protein family [Trichomonas vaginalis G3]|eukprot:XP_001325015.1 hypothetical protein [Trichomonas vaginalis G3]